MKSSTYKALILDVDGTTIKNQSDAMPSEKVKSAIRKADKIVKVGLATSRPFWHVIHIIEILQINAPCILAGGSQIYDPKLKKVVWEKTIEKNDVEQIFEISKSLGIEIKDDATGKHLRNEKLNINDYAKKGPLQFWVPNLKPDLSQIFIDKLSSISTIAALKVPSWENGFSDVIISHAQGTKQHGILEVAKLLNIKTHEIISVGDGDNDFPLLMACGLKIAMGNATEGLKQIADFVAPDVEDDGVATVIEKFIL